MINAMKKNVKVNLDLIASVNNKWIESESQAPNEC